VTDPLHWGTYCDHSVSSIDKVLRRYLTCSQSVCPSPGIRQPAMNEIAVDLKPFEDAAKQMQGWRFEYEPEVVGGDVPWNYDDIASRLLGDSICVIDLGTGGGETYLGLLEAKNCQAFATEEWERNAPIAATRLKGVASVTRCSSLVLPFPEETFDLILCRHEAIDPSEITRVLKPGGRLLSQQVIHDFMFELIDTFPDMAIFPDFFSDYKGDFSHLGLHIRQAEEFRYKVRFHELGHLVYQLSATPWTIPGFSVATHLDGLKLLGEKLMNDNGLQFTAGYYLLEVEKGI
jgi:SAM-dependent methyltransferase